MMQKVHCVIIKSVRLGGTDLGWGLALKLETAFKYNALALL